MENLGIEVILFGVLILVLILDLIIKGRKKKSDVDSTLKKIESATNDKDSNASFSLIKYLSERTRNIGLFLVSIFIFKVLINVVGFRKYWDVGEIIEYKPPKRFRPPGGIYKTKQGEFDFIDYITYIFEIDLLVFFYAFVVVSFIAWQLNPYIKKR